MVEIIALLMFVGSEQKLTEMTYMPSVKHCLEKRRMEFRRVLFRSVMLRICVQKLKQN